MPNKNHSAYKTVFFLPARWVGKRNEEFYLRPVGFFQPVGSRYRYGFDFDPTGFAQPGGYGKTTGLGCYKSDFNKQINYVGYLFTHAPRLNTNKKRPSFKDSLLYFYASIALVHYQLMALNVLTLLQTNYIGST